MVSARLESVRFHEVALAIDTPIWPWRGQLWAHMISDTSLEELHDAARTVGLRYLSFGRDHYDVPQSLWSQACEVAEHVDSREIVRSLRRSGLRVPGGKQHKQWTRIEETSDRGLELGADRWLSRLREWAPGTYVASFERPGESVVLHIGELIDRTPLRDFEVSVGPDSLREPLGISRVREVIETVSGGEWSMEVVLENDTKMSLGARADR